MVVSIVTPAISSSPSLASSGDVHTQNQQQLPGSFSTFLPPPNGLVLNDLTTSNSAHHIVTPTAPLSMMTTTATILQTTFVSLFYHELPSMGIFFLKNTSLTCFRYVHCCCHSRLLFIAWFFSPQACVLKTIEEPTLFLPIVVSARELDSIVFS